MTATATQLTGKKIVITTPDSSVYVFQDGSAAHSGATVKYDDAFRDGAQPSGTTSNVDKIWCDLQTYTVSHDSGRELTFTLSGSEMWLTNATGAQVLPLSKVELYADTPTTDATVTTPSWHLNEQTGQVRIFYGFIDTVESSSSSAALTVTCRDGLWKSKDISVVRSGAESIDVPRIIINPDLDRDNPDFWYAIKDLGGSSGFGTGESTEDDPKMTLSEILTYLADTYVTELGNAGCVTPANGVFDSGDLANLPTVTPTQITLDSAYWGEAVRSILGQWAPDFAIIQDPRTLVFRLVHWAASQTQNFTTTTGSTSNTGGGGYESSVTVTDTSIFSATTGNDGNLIRIFQGNAFQVLTVVAIVGSELRLAEDFATSYTSGAVVYAVAGTASPTLELNIDDALDVSATLSAQDAYSAVNIVSVNHETQTFNANWDPGSLYATDLNKGWDSAFEQFWTPEDADRETDYGLGGLGMQVYDIDTAGATDVLKVKYSESFWGSDHEDDEWNNCAVWVFSKAGGTAAKNDGITVKITDFATTADVGDGNAGFLITTDSADFVAAAGGSFGTEVSPVSSTVDRIGISHALEHGASDFNQRWKIGRMWTATMSGLSTSSGQDAAQAHFQVCQAPIIRAPSGAFGSGQGLSAGNGSFGYPRSNPAVIAYEGPWEILATGGLGSFQAARLGIVPPRPLQGHAPAPAGCGTRGWTPPRSVEVALETTTLTVRQARCPAAGHAGGAYQLFGLQRVKNILATGWQTDAQDSDYEALSCSLWRLHQEAHHQGSVTMPGIDENAAWVDLGIRCQLSTDQLVAGSRAMLDGFWGSLSTITLDFQSNRTTYDFSNKSGLSSLTFTSLESIRGISAEVAETKQVQTYLQQVIACNTNARIQGQQAPLWDTRVLSHGGRPAAPWIREATTKPDQALRVAPTAIDWPDTESGHSTSLGARASTTVVRDAAGQYWGIGAAGQYVPGSVSGSTFTPNLAETDRLVSSVDLNRDAITGLAYSTVGLNLAEVPNPVWTTISSSTTTTISTDFTGFSTNEFQGGLLIVNDWDPDNPRAPITITSHTAGGAFTVPTITDDLPPDGTQVVVIPAAKPTPDPDTFTSGGIGYKDANGDWVVIDHNDGTMHATTEASGLLEDVGSPATREVCFGPYPHTGTISTLTLTAKANTEYDFSGSGAVYLPSTEKASAGTINYDSSTEAARIYTASGTRVLLSDVHYPITLTGYRTGTMADGTIYRMVSDSTDDDLRFPVPSGRTLYVLAVSGRMKAGSNVGTWTGAVGVRRYTDPAATTGTDYECGTSTGAEDTWIDVTAFGSISSPLATITGGNDVAILPYIENQSAPSGGASANVKSSVSIMGVMV